MDRKFFAIAITLLFSHTLGANLTDDFVINLKDPEYINGVVKTEKGGVITACDLRVQAQKITYINTEDEQKIIAEGDLMMEHLCRIFVGERLEYDIKRKTGCLTKGRTKDGAWYIGGDTIELADDGSFTLINAFITPSIDYSNPWEITADYTRITDGQLLTAKDVRFKIFNFPVLWVPVFKTDLQKRKDPALKYRVQWDKNIGPRVSARYRFYSTEHFSAYARFDYRFAIQTEEPNRFNKFGPGGALEAEYLSEDKRTMFQTRNYGANDKEYADQLGFTRYRFQGIFKTVSEDEYSRFHAQWDRLSDQRMVNEWLSRDFTVSTQKVSYLEGTHYAPWAFGSLTVRPKLNRFDTLNEELPTNVFGLRPFEIGNTGIIMENYAIGSYLKYDFFNSIPSEVRPVKAGRVESLNSIYRPISLFGLNATPRGGLAAIYYSDSPDKDPVTQFLFSYGGDVNMRFFRQYEGIKHQVEPYAVYSGYTRPKVAVDDYFVFSLNDGYDQVDQLRFGLKQYLYQSSLSIFRPALSLDLYSYAFWGAASFSQTFPKAFLDVQVEQPSWSFTGNACWNIQENVLDYGNAGALWTLSSYLAIGAEFRHRSRFWWRKADYENFVLDFARTVDEMLETPLSDQRNTILTKAHVRLSPRWNFHLQTYHGWARKNEPHYNGVKVEFYSMLIDDWQVRVGYEYTPSNKFQFSWGFNLIR